MSFEWGDFLVFAEQASSSDDECELRNAISRAYYATYHAARELVEARTGDSPPREKSHQWVWRTLGTLGPQYSPLERKGARLKEARNQADYDNPFGEDVKRKAEFALSQAKDIIGKVRR